MKTLSAGQTAELAKGGWAVRRWLKVTWPNPTGAKWYSDRAGSVDGTAAEALVEGWPEFQRQMGIGLEAELISSQVQVTLRNDGDADDPLRTILEGRAAAQGAKVEFYATVNDATPETADLICLGIYYLADWNFAAERVALICEDYWLLAGDREVGKAITEDEYPQAPSESYGKIIPIVWGEVEESIGYPVTAGKTAKLDGMLDVGDGVIYVDDVSEFPASGSVLIGEEEIAYTAIDTAANSIGTAASPVLRGQNSTIETEHGDGTTVREKLASYRFVIADHACLSPADGASVTVLIGGKAVAGTAALGTDGRTYVDVAALPVVREITGGITRTELDAEDGGWADAGDSTCDTYDGAAIVETTAAGMVDSGDQRHVSGAILDAANAKSLASVEYSTDQTNRTSRFVKAKLELDYKIIPGESEASEGDGIAWGSPTIEVLRDGSRVALVDLGRPSEQDLRGYLADQTFTPQLEDSRPLFEFTSGVVGDSTSADALYVSGAGSHAESWLGQPVTDYIREYMWLLGNGTPPVAGQALSGPVGSMSVVAVVSQVLANAGLHIQYTGNSLVMRPDASVAADAGATYSALTAQVTFQGDSDVTAQLNLVVNGISHVVNATIPLNGETTTVRVSAADEGGYTQAQILAARLYISGGFFDLRVGDFSPYTITQSTTRYVVTAVSIACGTKPAQVGLEERLNGDDTTLEDAGLLGGSRTLTQKINLTTHIKDNYAANPWAFFDGTLAVKVAADAGTAPTKILIYDCRFVVDERAETVRQLTESEALLSIAITGIRGDIIYPGYPANMLLYLQTSSDWFGLPTAMVDVTSMLVGLSGREYWKLARRIDQRIKMRDLLAQMCRDLGLRVAWEGGRFRFAAMGTIYSASQAAADRDEMLGDTARKPIGIENISNQIEVYYHRSTDERRVFQRATGSRDAIASQGYPWGLRRETLDAEWIRDTATAQALAGALLDEVAYPRSILSVEGPLRWLDREIGDLVAVTDSDAGLSAHVGRVYAAAYPGDRVVLKLVAPQGYLRWWTDPLDSTNYINIYFGAQLQVAFYIADARVMAIDGAGQVRISGGWEMTEFGALEMTEKVEMDAVQSRIRVAVLQGETYHRALEIGSDGTLYCYAVALEAGTFPTGSGQSDYIEFGDGETDFSADLANTMAALTADVGTPVNGTLAANGLEENEEL